MRLGRLLHALREESLELVANRRGLTLEFVQELPCLVLDFGVRKERLPQPDRLPGADSAVLQDVVLDRLVKEMFESRVEMLHALVQLDEEVSILPVNLSIDRKRVPHR